jgi:murein DD-endopeptidase MepM/ murein hydrolase activator NlpD
VKKGENIGSVGNTAVFESLDESHLHFEVLIDGKNVDPRDYLPKSM